MSFKELEEQTEKMAKDQQKQKAINNIQGAYDYYFKRINKKSRAHSLN